MRVAEQADERRDPVEGRVDLVLRPPRPDLELYLAQPLGDVLARAAAYCRVVKPTGQACRGGEPALQAGDVRLGRGEPVRGTSR